MFLKQHPCLVLALSILLFGAQASTALSLGSSTSDSVEVATPWMPEIESYEAGPGMDPDGAS